MASASTSLRAAPLTQDIHSLTARETEQPHGLRRVEISQISDATATLILETRGIPRSLCSRVVSGVAECNSAEISGRTPRTVTPNHILLRNGGIHQPVESKESVPNRISEVVFSGLALIMQRHMADSTDKREGMISRASSEFSIAVNFAIRMLSYELGVTSVYPSPKSMTTASTLAKIIRMQNKSLHMKPRPRKVHEHLIEWQECDITTSMGLYSKAIAACFTEPGQKIIDGVKVDMLTESVRERLNSTGLPHYRKKLRFWNALVNDAVSPNDILPALKGGVS